MARDMAGVLSAGITAFVSRMRRPSRRDALLIRDPSALGFVVGPGSAEQRYTLHRVRHTRETSSADQLPHHPLAAGPEACLQHLLVDLADAGHRQLVDEFMCFGACAEPFLLSPG
jgi:hypothetical protein